jgi:hypothetical protein
MRRWKTLLLMVLVLPAALVILSRCGSGMLGDSKVPDTEENRAVYELMLEYKDALQKRDADHILALVSRDYLENGSTTDSTADDYGYQELAEEVLPKLLNNVKAIQFEFRPQAIDIIGDHANVQFEYTTHFLYSEGGRENWHSKNDLNEWSLIRTPDGWRILSGL